MVPAIYKEDAWRGDVVVWPNTHGDPNVIGNLKIKQRAMGKKEDSTDI